MKMETIQRDRRSGLCTLPPIIPLHRLLCLKQYAACEHWHCSISWYITTRCKLKCLSSIISSIVYYAQIMIAADISYPTDSLLNIWHITYLLKRRYLCIYISFFDTQRNFAGTFLVLFSANTHIRQLWLLLITLLYSQTQTFTLNLTLTTICFTLSLI